MRTSSPRTVFCSYFSCSRFLSLFFFNDPATTAIYTLSLHDALPISTSPAKIRSSVCVPPRSANVSRSTTTQPARDRKSTRLNSSHRCISYAVFCLKKKNKKTKLERRNCVESWDEGEADLECTGQPK